MREKQLADLSKWPRFVALRNTLRTERERFSFASGDIPTDRLRPLAGIQRTFTIAVLYALL